MYTVIRRLYYFFFQAEDGIRDTSVTGVQTCALPISRRRRAERADGGERGSRGAAGQRSARELAGRPHRVRPARADAAGLRAADARGDRVLAGRSAEIGRASCRERGESGAGGVYVQRK